MVSVGFHFHHDGAVFEGVGAGPFGGFADGQWGGGLLVCPLYYIGFESYNTICRRSE